MPFKDPANKGVLEGFAIFRTEDSSMPAREPTTPPPARRPFSRHSEDIGTAYNADYRSE